MKKFCVGLLLMILILSLSGFSYADEIPAPFAKAKEMALKAEPDADGRYILDFKTQGNNQTCHYMIGYLPQEKIIGVGMLKPDFIIYEYWEISNQCAVFLGDFGISYFLDRDDIIKEASKIFRHFMPGESI